MAIEHVNIADGERHEPKGISTATAGQAYIADGATGGDWLLPAGAHYGELYITGGVTSQTLPAASAYAKLNPTGAWVAAPSFGVTPIAADGTLTVTVNGEYRLDFWIGLTTAAIAASVKYHFKYAVNGVVATRRIVVQKNTAGADVINVSAVGHATLVAGDIVSIYVAGDATSSSTAITPLEAGLIVTLLKN